MDSAVTCASMTGWIDHAAGLVGIRMRRLCRVRRSRMEKRPCDRDKFEFSILLRNIDNVFKQSRSTFVDWLAMALVAGFCVPVPVHPA